MFHVKDIIVEKMIKLSMMMIIYNNRVEEVIKNDDQVKVLILMNLLE